MCWNSTAIQMVVGLLKWDLNWPVEAIEWYRGSNKSLRGLRFSYIFNRSFELVFTRGWGWGNSTNICANVKLPKNLAWLQFWVCDLCSHRITGFLDSFKLKKITLSVENNLYYPSNSPYKITCTFNAIFKKAHYFQEIRLFSNIFKSHP
jgi:hypothetical protein